jgi:60 kDa SS-A/Ro ribonucleoprotein
VIRIAHPKGRTSEHSTLIGWLAGNVDDVDARSLVPDIDNFLTAQQVTTPAEAIDVITRLRVPWEFLPPAVLADPGVWAALAGTVGLTALLRNLAKMTRIGTLNPFSYEVNDLVVKRLTSPQAVAKARIHPMDVYLALRTYQSGISRPDRRQPARTWNPVAVISDALETMYDHAFAAVEPSGKRLLVAVDSSGSMAYSRVVIGGSDLGRAYDVANTVAVTLARIEPRVHVINVDTQLHPSRVTRRTNLRELAIWKPSGGGTDMALPFSWALQRSRPFDGIVVLTDNETWAGRSHPVQALEQYRRSVNRDARAIVVSMTATGYSILGNDTPGVLQVAGLDGSLPTLIAGFIKRGE